MSGHSKWHNIRVKKTAADAARGKIYTRHAKLIEIAAQRGGDPDTNPGLRTAIDNAKEDNVPNANIERAIKKGTGELKGERMEELTYAAYLPVRSSAGAKEGGPGSSIALIIECLTDNKNRTLGNLKLCLGKKGGTFAESASVMWMFQRKGVVSARMPNVETSRGDVSADELELHLIDAGAEEIEEDGDMLTVTTDMTAWPTVRDLLKERGFSILSAGLRYVPMQKAPIADAASARKLMELIEALEEDDDIAEVHTNADISEEAAKGLGD